MALQVDLVFLAWATPVRTRATSRTHLVWRVDVCVCVCDFQSRHSHSGFGWTPADIALQGLLCRRGRCSSVPHRRCRCGFMGWPGVADYA